MKSIRLIAAVTSMVVSCCFLSLVILNDEEFERMIPQFKKVQIFSKEQSSHLIEKISNGLRPAYHTSKHFKCFEVEVDWQKKVRPRYLLNPTKFLIPTLLNGPNNQMMGFQQSILLSLLLNRTLVLPLFYHHEIDKFFRTIVPVEYRVNIQKLREFMSVIPLQRALTRCNHTFDGIFAGRSFNLVKKGTASIVRISMETGFRAVDFVDDVGKKEITLIKKYLYSDRNIHVEEKFRRKLWWPANKKDRSWTSHILKSDRHGQIPILPKGPGSSNAGQIRTLYSTDAKCVLHWYPFRQYSFRKSNENVKSDDLHQFSGEDGRKLQSDIVLHTPPPDAVLAWSEHFQNTYLRSSNNTYIAMHWRFDDKDFFDFICARDSRRNFCDGVKRATNTTAIAKAILIRIANLDRRSPLVRIGAVYIAAPPTLKNFIHEIASKLTDVEFVRNMLPSHVPIPRIVTSKQLKDFLLKNYKSCAMGKSDQILDTISQIEMDVCAHSHSFLWSRQSTWSLNVNNMRSLYHKVRNIDRTLPDFILEIIKHGY